MLSIANVCPNTAKRLEKFLNAECPREPQRAMLGKSTMLNKTNSVTFVVSPDLPAHGFCVRRRAAASAAMVLSGAKA